MHKCGEERRRLAAEWAEFFAQQKLSKERAEREAERALQVDTQREGALVSLAKVGLRVSSSGSLGGPGPFLPWCSLPAAPLGCISLAKSLAINDNTGTKPIII